MLRTMPIGMTLFVGLVYNCFTHTFRYLGHVTSILYKFHEILLKIFNEFLKLNFHREKIS